MFCTKFGRIQKMASSVGTVLFHRGKTGTDSETDLWDDTALIKAYDHAVNKVKAQMKKQLGQDASDSEQKPTDKRKNNKRKKKRKNRQKKVWKVGDACRAVYTEDGQMYDAEIVTMNTEEGTCFVQYVGYGNEEEQRLDNLQPRRRRGAKQEAAMTASDIEGSSMAESMEWGGQKDAHSSTGSRSSRQHSQMPQFPWPGGANCPFYPMSAPNFPFMPSQASMPSFSSNPFQTPNNIPFMPPPPPLLDGDPGDTDNEALCSMLMSWYMSGYHTGYYQGLKQAHQTNRGGTSPRPDSFR